MKNLINVLLYVLLGLLVVTISVMIYKKFKTPVDSTAAAEPMEQSYIDSTGNQALPFSAEDSIILGLTGELPTKVGPDFDNSTPTQVNSAIQENVSPVAKPVANHEAARKSENKMNNAEAKTETKAATKNESKSSSTKVMKSSEKANTTAQNKKETTKTATEKSSTTGKGNYYVISGSFLVPSNADNQVAKLKKLGFFNSTKKVFANASSYSAIAGQYETEAAARASLNKLKSKGEPGFIKKI
ncbi:MAG: SPOR domain-containing protein [Saprospiraceae bacterium]